MAALDAMRKAHQNEVQREVSRFKAEFVQQLQNGGQSYDAHKETEYALLLITIILIRNLFLIC